MSTQRRNPGPQLPRPDEVSTPLQVLVVRRMWELGADEKDGAPLSYRDVMERAADGGHTLSMSTMTNVVNKNLRLREATIEALAYALELDEETVRRAMNRSLAAVEMKIPAKIAKKLTAEGWAELIAHAEFLAHRDSNP